MIKKIYLLLFRIFLYLTKKTYIIFTNIFIAITAVLVIGFFMLFNQEIIPYFAKKYLHEYAIEYESIKGRLFDGITIRGVKYGDALKIDELNVKYNLLLLINPIPRVNSLVLKGAEIDVEEILKILNSRESSSSDTIALNISKIDLKNINIYYKKEKYSLNAQGFGFSLRDGVDFEKIKLDLESLYAKISLNGSAKGSVLNAKADIFIDKKIEQNYLNFLTYSPKKLEADLILSSKKIELKTLINSITIKDMQSLELNDADIEFIYNFDDEFFTVFADYSAVYDGYELFLTQQNKISIDLKYDIKLKAEILKQKIHLPFKRFFIDAKIDENGSKINFNADDIAIKAKTRDYENFLIDANSKYAVIDANLKIDNNTSTVNAQLYPKKDMPYFSELQLYKFPKINIFLSKNKEDIRAHLHCEPLSLTLLKDKIGLKGVAKIGSSKINIDGDLEKKVFNIDTTLESLKSLFYELNLKPFDENIIFDAKAKIKSSISYSDTLEIKTRLDIPWFNLEVVDSKSIYRDKDAFVEFLYKSNQITIQKYRVNLLDNKIYSNKESKIALNEDGTIGLKEFWVYDNMLATGLINPSQKSVDIRLVSDNFHYESKDANVTLNIDIHATIDRSGIEKVDGDIVLLDGKIMYVAKKEYAISDKDIIIIQDIKTQEAEKKQRELNIRISSNKPIRYKIKDVDILFSPNLTIYKDIDTSMQILGMIKIHENSTLSISDKNFEFDDSEIYFYDEAYTNPYLNLNIHYYTLDYVDIEIYITNRVNSPVIILSSNPHMSQDDILSYILFGGSASSVFDTGGRASKISLSTVLLGAGLKELFNKSTNFRVDTLNILTNKSGTLGYEVGARFSKNIRVVYKHDDISMLILQYSLNKSMRIDVEAKQTGQGVGIYYIKDFKSPKVGDLKD